MNLRSIRKRGSCQRRVKQMRVKKQTTLHPVLPRYFLHLMCISVFFPPVQSERISECSLTAATAGRQIRRCVNNLLVCVCVCVKKRERARQGMDRDKFTSKFPRCFGVSARDTRPHGMTAEQDVACRRSVV